MCKQVQHVHIHKNNSVMASAGFWKRTAAEVHHIWFHHSKKHASVVCALPACMSTHMHQSMCKVGEKEEKWRGEEGDSGMQNFPT